MIPQRSIFWPIEDVGQGGFCYGWVNARLVCVAGVLQVESLGERALTPRPRAAVCLASEELNVRAHAQNVQRPSWTTFSEKTLDSRRYLPRILR